MQWAQALEPHLRKTKLARKILGEFRVSSAKDAPKLPQNVGPLFCSHKTISKFPQTFLPWTASKRSKRIYQQTIMGCAGASNCMGSCADESVRVCYISETPSSLISWNLVLQFLSAGHHRSYCDPNVRLAGTGLGREVETIDLDCCSPLSVRCSSQHAVQDPRT